MPSTRARIYQGTLVRTADAIDPVSRTLLVEIDVNNSAGELLPGSLAQVHFKTPAAGPTFIVPAAALIFRKEGMRVGTVVNGNVAHLVPVVIGEDDGANVQIVSGLGAGDQVIQDPPDSLIEGEKVRVVNPGQCGRQVVCRPVDRGLQTRGDANSRLASPRCGDNLAAFSKLESFQNSSAICWFYPPAGCKPVGPNYNRPGYRPRQLTKRPAQRPRCSSARPRWRRMAARQPLRRPAARQVVGDLQRPAAQPA